MPILTKIYLLQRGSPLLFGSVSASLIFLLLAHYCYAQPMQDPRVSVENFFDQVIQGEPATGLGALLKGSSMAEGNPEQLARLQEQIQAVIEAKGSARGYELIAAERVGSSVLYLKYILLLEQVPLAWRFYYYRIGEAWEPISVHFDSRLVDP